jgi:hypothetical protein
MELRNNALQQTAIKHMESGSLEKFCGFGKQRQIADLALRVKS